MVLAGEEGIGKSMLAHAYTRHFGMEYRTIVWINAATDETLLADLYEVLQKWALPVDMTQGSTELFQRLHTYLSKQERALLILDQIPFAFKLQDPSVQLPLSYDFLLITRREETPAELPRLELTDLEARDGASLALRQAGLLAEQEQLDSVGDELRVAALELARELRGVPLALCLAGGYLRLSGISIQNYLDLFRSYPAHLRFDNDEQQELVVACELCLSWLEQTHPEARELLQTYALFLPETLPGIWWQQGEAVQLAQQQTTLQLLLDMGLLNASEESSMGKMHPLLQQLTRQFYGLDNQSQQPLVEQLLCRWQSLLPILEEDALPVRLRVAGYIRHLARLSSEWEQTTPKVAEVLVWAARQLWQQYLFKPAEALLRQALGIWEKAPETSQLAKALVREKLAALNAQMGNYAEAETLTHQALTARLEAQGVNHPDVLNSLLQLGQFYAAQKKADEAEACYRKVIALAEKLNLRLHPVYSRAKYHLALLAIEQQKWEQAEDLLRRVSITWKHILGKDHRSTVQARLQLAEVAIQLKHWELAQKEYQQALPGYEKEGKDDPHVQKIKHILEENALSQNEAIAQ